MFSDSVRMWLKVSLYIAVYKNNRSLLNVPVWVVKLCLCKAGWAYTAYKPSCILDMGLNERETEIVLQTWLPWQQSMNRLKKCCFLLNISFSLYVSLTLISRRVDHGVELFTETDVCVDGSCNGLRLNNSPGCSWDSSPWLGSHVRQWDPLYVCA